MTFCIHTRLQIAGAQIRMHVKVAVIEDGGCWLGHRLQSEAAQHVTRLNKKNNRKSAVVGGISSPKPEAPQAYDMDFPLTCNLFFM